ncbi:MATE efflux family protein [Nitzschia inconspicua]|uniref:MATE efflux family protein n=1 Tax=Nitzschia inconspicua TaxID=303405 RepID=A0A9K3KSB4_9STRA|nr:MATE efflux family protein [Nitzschia inconspicua]
MAGDNSYYNYDGKNGGKNNDNGNGNNEKENGGKEKDDDEYTNGWYPWNYIRSTSSASNNDYNGYNMNAYEKDHENKYNHGKGKDDVQKKNNEEAANVSYDDYVPTAIQKDFTYQTIACCIVVILLLYPLVVCTRYRKRKRRKIKRHIQYRAEQDAKRLTETLTLPPFYVPMEDDAVNQTEGHRPLGAFQPPLLSLDDVLASMDLFIDEVDSTRYVTLRWQDEEGTAVEHAVAAPTWAVGVQRQAMYRKQLGRAVAKKMMTMASTRPSGTNVTDSSGTHVHPVQQQDGSKSDRSSYTSDGVTLISMVESTVPYQPMPSGNEVLPTLNDLYTNKGLTSNTSTQPSDVAITSNNDLGQSANTRTTLSSMELTSIPTIAVNDNTAATVEPILPAKDDTSGCNRLLPSLENTAPMGSMDLSLPSHIPSYSANDTSITAQAVASNIDTIIQPSNTGDDIDAGVTKEQILSLLEDSAGEIVSIPEEMQIPTDPHDMQSQTPDETIMNTAIVEQTTEDEWIPLNTIDVTVSDMDNTVKDPTIASSATVLIQEKLENNANSEGNDSERSNDEQSMESFDGKENQSLQDDVSLTSIIDLVPPQIEEEDDRIVSQDESTTGNEQEDIGRANGDVTDSGDVQCENMALLEGSATATPNDITKDSHASVEVNHNNLSRTNTNEPTTTEISIPNSIDDLVATDDGKNKTILCDGQVIDTMIVGLDFTASDPASTVNSTGSVETALIADSPGEMAAATDSFVGSTVAVDPPGSLMRPTQSNDGPTVVGVAEALKIVAAPTPGEETLIVKPVNSPTVWKSSVTPNDGMIGKDIDQRRDDEGDDDDSIDVIEYPKGCRTLAMTMACDHESKRILGLAVPSTIGSATTTITSTVSTALISYHMGTENYVAYSMVYVLTGFADALYSGIAEAKSLLVARAVGSENPFLAGQYEQAGMLLEYICAIPLYTIVFVFFPQIIALLGLEPEVSQLGQLFLPWYIASLLFSDISSTISELMWADERGSSMTILDNVYNGMYLSMLCLLVFGHDSIGIETPNLRHLGILTLLAAILYNIMIIGFVTCKGWLAPYRKGLLQSFSFHNPKLVRSLLQMSVPLTFGGIVATFQWELLTVVAAHIGSPAVAAWTLLGSIWNVFEYLPNGFTTAAELRVCRHLGQGNPGMAKVSAYKCLIYSISSTAVISIIFVSARNVIVGWYSDVEIIQAMLSDLILLVGIANVVMVVGVVAYSILCAQNRANIATGTYVVLSFATTLPLSLYLVYYKKYDLQSMVFALIVGYCLSSLVLLVFLFTSNWRRYSEAAIRQNQERSTGSSTNKEMYDKRQHSDGVTNYAAMDFA